MATRAEAARSQAQRTGGKGRRKPRVSVRKPKKAAWSHDKGHARSKATHALEDAAPGKRPSRESTRGSSNRAKGDSAFNLTEETRKTTPENRARKARARVVKVRGGGASRPASASR